VVTFTHKKTLGKFKLASHFQIKINSNDIVYENISTLANIVFDFLVLFCQTDTSLVKPNNLEKYSFTKSRKKSKISSLEVKKSVDYRMCIKV